MNRFNIWLRAQTLPIPILYRAQQGFQFTRGFYSLSSHFQYHYSWIYLHCLRKYMWSLSINRSLAPQVPSTTSALVYFCGELTLAACQMPTKATLSAGKLLPQSNREDKIQGNYDGQDKNRERSFTAYCHRQTRLNSGTSV